MDRSAAVVATALAGGLIAAQAPVNGKLGGTIGSAPATAINFFVGLVALIGVVLVSGRASAFADIRGAGLPWWCFIGGLLGAIYVLTAAASVGSLGAGGITAATIAGQLTASVVIDQFGLLGVARDPVTVSRLTGIVLLAAGVFLVVRK